METKLDYFTARTKQETAPMTNMSAVQFARQQLQRYFFRNSFVNNCSEQSSENSLENI